MKRTNFARRLSGGYVLFPLGIWSQREQARTQFAIEAAKIVLQTHSRTQSQATVDALAHRERLPPNFAQSFNPNSGCGPDIIDAKRDLLKVLPEAPPDRQK